MKKTLHLNLIRKWFDMIKSGEKKEEYREITWYWATRLLYKIPFPGGGFLSCIRNIMCGDYVCKGWVSDQGIPMFRDFNSTTFSNGYSKDRDQFEIELKGIEIKEGNPDWGAIPGKKYFVLELGDIL